MLASFKEFEYFCGWAFLTNTGGYWNDPEYINKNGVVIYNYLLNGSIKKSNLTKKHRQTVYILVCKLLQKFAFLSQNSNQNIFKISVKR